MGLVEEPAGFLLLLDADVGGSCGTVGRTV